MTEATKEETFASVVSRDTVRLFVLLASLNDLELLSCDIENAYLAAPNKEKVWTKFTDQLGPEYSGKPSSQRHSTDSAQVGDHFATTWLRI